MLNWKPPSVAAHNGCSVAYIVQLQQLHPARYKKMWPITRSIILLKDHKCCSPLSLKKYRQQAFSYFFQGCFSLLRAMWKGLMKNINQRKIITATQSKISEFAPMSWFCWKHVWFNARNFHSLEQTRPLTGLPNALPTPMGQYLPQTSLIATAIHV